MLDEFDVSSKGYERSNSYESKPLWKILSNRPSITRWIDVMLALNTKIDLSYFWSGDYSYFERITVYKQRKVD